MSQNVGGGEGSGVSANEYSCTYTGAQINFGDLTPYLSYAKSSLVAALLIPSIHVSLEVVTFREYSVIL